MKRNYRRTITTWTKSSTKYTDYSIRSLKRIMSHSTTNRRSNNPWAVFQSSSPTIRIFTISAVLIRSDIIAALNRRMNISK